MVGDNEEGGWEGGKSKKLQLEGKMCGRQATSYCLYESTETACNGQPESDERGGVEGKEVNERDAGKSVVIDMPYAVYLISLC